MGCCCGHAERGGPKTPPGTLKREIRPALRGRSFSWSPTLMRVIDRGERLGLCAPVLYEWRRGPRTDVELAVQEGLLPTEMAWPFGAAEALVAADLYRRLPRARARELDFAIAACALTRGARLWTLNPEDVTDIPELALFALERA